MAIVRTYQCPKCEKCFDFTHHPNDEPPPNFCPLCGADVSGRKKTRMKKVDRVLSPGLAERLKKMPNHERKMSKSADAVFRGMQNAAEGRIQEAAATLGVSASELSGMKFNDMKDSMREGEMAQSTSMADAAKLVGDAPIASQAGGGAINGLGFNNNASEYARSTGSGPSPFAGAKAREMVTSLHASKGNRIVSAGRINKT